MIWLPKAPPLAPQEHFSWCHEAPALRKSPFLGGATLMFDAFPCKKLFSWKVFPHPTLVFYAFLCKKRFSWCHEAPALRKSPFLGGPTLVFYAFPCTNLFSWEVCPRPSLMFYASPRKKRFSLVPRSPSFKDCLSTHLVTPFWCVLLLHPSGCFFQNENFLRIFLRSLKVFLSGTSFLLLHPRAFCTKGL